MTIAPPGHHVVKEHIRRNPGPRRRKTATKVGSGAGAAIGVGALVLLLTGALGGGGGGGGGGSHTNTGNGTGITQQNPAVPPANGAQPPAGQNAAGPAPNDAAAAAGSTTAYARQYNLIVRSAPDLRSEAVATLAWNNTVTLLCHTTGPRTISFNGGRTETWDKIRTIDGTIGYVSDGWVLTTAQVDQLVPAC